MTSKAYQQTRPFGIIKSVLDVDDYTTTVNTYENVYSWDTEFLQGKVLRFSAATNDLHVKILGSVDGGATYPITAESEFTVAVATPVVKRISNYYSFLKIQVKPAVAAAHGVLTTTGSGSSIPDFSDIEVTVTPAITVSSCALPTGAATEATLADIKTAAQIIDNFISGSRGLVTEDNSVAILAKLTSDPSTATLQTSGNASLTSIDGKLSAKVQLHANIDFSSASAQTIIAAPGSGYRIRIVQLLLMSGAPTPINSEIAIKSGSTTIKTVRAAAIALDYPEHCNLGTNEAFVLQATTADRVVGGVDYYIEAV